MDGTCLGRLLAGGGTGVHEPGMVSCLFRIVPLQENDSCSEIAMDDAVIAAALKLEHPVVDDNWMLRFPILVSTVVFLFF